MKIVTYSVSSLNNYIKSRFASDPNLLMLRVKGEISNLKRYPSGHIYFSLKDDTSVIKCVMFATYTRYAPETLKDGDEIIAQGSVSVYEARGEYQLYVNAIEVDGLGQKLIELELLKKKLAAEGLFDEDRKREINLYPKAIGVISAPNSAAMADIKTNLHRRYPLVEVKCFPSLVQGEDAPKDLLRALNEASKEDIDTLIIGRGGGASEDLSAFNDETLVRAVAAFKVPVISAVGHEIDFTLIDYVADKRASTPTGAAELATVDKREIYMSLDEINEDLDDIIGKKILELSTKLDKYRLNPYFKNPSSIYESKLDKVRVINEKLTLIASNYIKLKQSKVESIKGRLNNLSVDNVLSRGYTIARTKSGKVITKSSDVNIDDLVDIKLKDGSITSKVVSK